MKTTYLIATILIFAACCHASEPQFDFKMFTLKPTFALPNKPFTSETNYMSLPGYMRYLLQSARTAKAAVSNVEGTVWTDGNLDIHFYQSGKTEVIYRTFYSSNDEKTTLVREEDHIFMFTWQQEGNYILIKHKETLLDGTPRRIYEGLIIGNTIVGLKRIGASTPTLWSVNLWKSKQPEK